ncbi:EscU/YscU/HrcU family type III secretion system export apparatus switch protein [Rhizobium helianthi]|uniref:EscU/YscU/HrcU family type III secretion system export apparatus switch protein n=1 Tax=Rhizobium helianthi TaxID=1132695 RepID=A0ABW4MBD0_9HYPH
MAGDDDTEEKTLPPSDIKLARLRRDGQIAHSQDLPAAVSVLLITGMLVGGYAWLFRSAADFFEPVFAFLPVHQQQLPDRQIAGLLYAAAQQVFALLAPLLILGLAGTFIAAIIDSQGLVISMKNLRFDASRLNPAQGFKRIFSLNSLSEFLKSFLKCTVLTLVGAATLLYFLNSLFWAPLCGTEQCALVVTSYLTYSLAVIIAIILIVTAAIDVKISRALFRHENRMTKTEAKREQKEMYGDPEVRSARRQIGAEIRN